MMQKLNRLFRFMNEVCGDLSGGEPEIDGNKMLLKGCMKHFIQCSEWFLPKKSDLRKSDLKSDSQKINFAEI